MKAVVYAGPGRVALEDVPEPRLVDPADAVVEVKRAAICGSDLHLLDGTPAGMRAGGVIGHEFVGILREAGPRVSKHAEGDRVLGSFLIACGACSACVARRFNHCHNRRALGMGELTGDLDGAQAEQVRVPDADVNLHTLEGDLAAVDDERALFAGDILATGVYAAGLGEVAPGDNVVVLGAGPVGLFCALAAKRRRAGRILVLDTDPGRIEFVDKLGLDGRSIAEGEAHEIVDEATGGELADVVIEAVGHVGAFRSAMRCTRGGGRVVVVGIYGAERYELPMGMSWVRALQLVFAGMANVQANWDEALEAVAHNEIDPTQLITHRLPLEEAPEGYELFRSRRALKVVLIP
jgi:threonine dehydrogenase-like Zn-dependent dehydrogenase